MNITKKDLTKAQIELTVELSVEEFQPYIKRGVEKVSREVKIEGFRPGKAPYEILKSKIGEMTILEESARIAIDKTLDQAIKENIAEQLVGQPQINITKLALDNPLEYKVILALLPQVKLGDYKNLQIKQAKVEVKSDEVDKLISQLREMRSSEKISETAVKENNKVIVDLEMFIDKVPLEGGQGKGTSVIIGKNFVVPGFDQKLIGANKDDVREFNLLYPADFHQANLAGRLVDFRVKVKEIYQRELPEVNEDFVKGFGLKTAAEFKENIKKSLLAEKEHEAERQAEVAMLEKIISQCKFGDIPEMLVDHEAKVMMSELEHSVESQGGKFVDYLSHLKKTSEQLLLDLLPDAIKRVKVSLIIREIARLEKIAATEQEVNQEIEAVLKQYVDKQDIIERIKSLAYREYVINNLTSRKVVKELKEWNVSKN
ncbi:trigger factor [Candidatus Falkowbacteria bacterium CG_4_9_14_3_um_filter_38_19]|uniref:Trigger factor n=2 Tax=Candidatus Falkowiibacteriota TaxID=1752728 RepID=A0A2M6WQX9_9BACT|nr:MAG: trigger factor [Candidatus Falkowbacteria bacterium CG10_big_fil_rev_8_21_14_0_10_38_22]PJB15995.1 MAG: trigger factor [Candidatus Falkowbacteria bacterium CG_4_9_14_3_um_filter_38_19]